VKVKELKHRLEQFRKLLQEHYSVWGHSLDSALPDYPIANGPHLQEQMDSLARQLGTLRPYIDKFGSSSIMTLPATGIRWDLYESAVSNDLAQRKGPSIQNAFPQLQQILGRLDAMDDEQEISLAGQNKQVGTETPPNETPAKTVSHAQYEELAKQHERLKTIVLGGCSVLAALIVAVVCEIALQRHPWGWLIHHSNSTAIRVFFYISILGVFIGLAVPDIRRRWLTAWLPSVIVPLAIALLQAVTGH
jgi:hypothetical protein